MHISSVFVFVLCLISPGTRADTFVENLDYHRLEVDIQSDADVVEFFTYACVHCYHAEREVRLLLEKEGMNVTFKRVPVSLGHQKAVVGVYAYYVAKKINILDRVHSDLFASIHEPGYKRRTGKADMDAWQEPPPPLGDVLDGTEALKRYFALKGVAGDVFDRTLAEVIQSDVVASNDRLAKKIKLTTTPTFLVKGRYVITGIGRYKGGDFVELVDYLMK